jgi:hypothetical protein
VTAALAIITDGFRESNIIPLGQTPNANQQAEGLTRLKALIASVYGWDVGAPLRDWPVGISAYNESQAGWNSGDWSYPTANSRLIVNITTPQTIYLPQNPKEGARIGLVDIGGNLATYNVTVDGNGRTVEGQQSVVLDTDSAERAWIYRADKGNWERIDALANVDAEMPFPEEFDDYFVTQLAMRLNPRYGRAISQETATRMAEIKNQLVARYRQPRNIHADPGALQMNRTRYGRRVDPYNPPFGE